MSFVNNVKLTLAGELSPTQTRLRLLKAVAPMQDPPESGKITLTDNLSNPTSIEIISYQRRNDNGEYWTLLELERGLEGSVVGSFLAGAFAFQTFTAQNATEATPLKKPQPTYTDGVLVRMDYEGGAFKVFGYNEQGLVSSVTTTSGESVSVSNIGWIDGVFSGIT